MPTTPDYAKAAEIEFEIKRLLIETFDAYGDEERLAGLQMRLAKLRKDLSELRTPQFADAA